MQKIFIRTILIFLVPSIASAGFIYGTIVGDGARTRAKVEIYCQNVFVAEDFTDEYGSYQIFVQSGQQNCEIRHNSAAAPISSANEDQLYDFEHDGYSLVQL